MFMFSLAKLTSVFSYGLTEEYLKNYPGEVVQIICSLVLISALVIALLLFVYEQHQDHRSLDPGIIG